MVRVGLEVPSWRMTMVPGARFFVTKSFVTRPGECTRREDGWDRAGRRNRGGGESRLASGHFLHYEAEKTDERRRRVALVVGPIDPGDASNIAEVPPLRDPAHKDPRARKSRVTSVGMTDFFERC